VIDINSILTGSIAALIVTIVGHFLSHGSRIKQIEREHKLKISFMREEALVKKIIEYLEEISKYMNKSFQGIYSLTLELCKMKRKPENKELENLARMREGFNIDKSAFLSDPRKFLKIMSDYTTKKTEIINSLIKLKGVRTEKGLLEILDNFEKQRMELSDKRAAILNYFRKEIRG